MVIGKFILPDVGLVLKELPDKVAIDLSPTVFIFITLATNFRELAARAVPGSMISSGVSCSS